MNRTAVSEQLGAGIPAAEIRAQLERILASSWFRNSKRHTRFLRFIVDKALAGEVHDIHERSIGIEVFDRRPDYDLANDAIVRVGAGEIRKRLAQYYFHEGRSNEIVIEVPPGAYVPIFRPIGHAAMAPNAAIEKGVESTTSRGAELSSSAVPQSKPQALLRELLRGRRWRRPVSLGIAMALALTVMVTVLVFLLRPSNDLISLWKPLLTRDRPVLVCVGDLRSSTPLDTVSISRESVTDFIHKSNHVGPSNLSAMARLVSVLNRARKPVMVVMADDTDLTALRRQPDLFTGFDNVWTRRILSDSRFRYQQNPAMGWSTIVDSRNPQLLNWTFNANAPVAEIRRDFALVARIESPLTGQPALIMAGLGPYGTTAASEFVTNPEYFRQFTSKAPRGWEQKNIEIVLSTEVVDGRSSPPHMIEFDVR